MSLHQTLYQRFNSLISNFTDLKLVDTLPTTNLRHSISHCSTLSTNNQIFSFHISLEKILNQPPTSVILYLTAAHSLPTTKFIQFMFHWTRYSTNHQLPTFHISLQHTFYQQPNLFFSCFTGQDTQPTTNFRHSISQCSTLSTNNQIYLFHISLHHTLYLRSWAGMTLTVIDDVTRARPAITRLASPKSQTGFRAYLPIVQN